MVPKGAAKCEEEIRQGQAEALRQAAVSWREYEVQCVQNDVEPLSVGDWLEERAQRYAGNGVGGW